MAALNAMKVEFTDFEAEPSGETIEGIELAGFDMNFYCLDLDEHGPWSAAAAWASRP